MTTEQGSKADQHIREYTQLITTHKNGKEYLNRDVLEKYMADLKKTNHSMYKEYEDKKFDIIFNYKPSWTISLSDFIGYLCRHLRYISIDYFTDYELYDNLRSNCMSGQYRFVNKELLYNKLAPLALDFIRKVPRTHAINEILNS